MRHQLLFPATAPAGSIPQGRCNPGEGPGAGMPPQGRTEWEPYGFTRRLAENSERGGVSARKSLPGEGNLCLQGARHLERAGPSSAAGQVQYHGEFTLSLEASDDGAFRPSTNMHCAGGSGEGAHLRAPLWRVEPETRSLFWRPAGFGQKRWLSRI